ncbi:MAG: GNAT family N-acetyltransferase [Oscillospiraceae bacterium]|jgi:RimJ/RimL family protein N-acetyltransferase|nr:GNAT family N-acetyltransferase [Oscillospiraceae bacterium]
MDGTIADEWSYYLGSPEYKPGKDVFCKVALRDKTPVAVMIVLCDPNFPVGINPIVVNPSTVGSGFGSLVIGEFLANIDAILPRRGDVIEVGVMAGNVRAIRMFERAGFELAGAHPDGDFLYYRYEIRP